MKVGLVVFGNDVVRLSARGLYMLESTLTMAGARPFFGAMYALKCFEQFIYCVKYSSNENGEEVSKTKE